MGKSLEARVSRSENRGSIMSTVYQKYEYFPWRIVIPRLSFLVIWFFSGSFLMWLWGVWSGVFFTFFAIFVFSAVFLLACRHCAYYGKRCDLGVSLFVTKILKKGGDHSFFIQYARKTIPLLIVLPILPIAVGIYLFFYSFSLLMLIFVMMNLLSIGAIAYTSPRWSCPHCLMADCCPLSPFSKIDKG